ncbi:MAG: hypothetical protein IJ364_00030 [Oscillospiraceae bacterium]|nr:hypothetical protein [Oscillospiraceae bacterium]
MSKHKPKAKPASGVLVSKAELEELIKAKTERDLILSLAAQKGFHSYQLDELLKVLLKLNGITPEGGADA